MDHKINTDMRKEINTELIMNFTQTYRVSWKRHVLRIPRSRIPFPMLRYLPKEKTYRKTLQTGE
jgi:hypothetical protein